MLHGYNDEEKAFVSIYIVYEVKTLFYFFYHMYISGLMLASLKFQFSYSISTTGTHLHHEIESHIYLIYRLQSESENLYTNCRTTCMVNNVL